MRVALVYDRLNKVGGAERVLQAFHELSPQADWYTSFWDPSHAPFSKDWRVRSFPYLRNHHEWFPWLMPFIFESYDFSSYDLVISIGSAEAKGIITRPGTTHLHYCLTPTRYLYSHAQEYLSNWLYRLIALWLRKWDQVASSRPDQMIAISTQVKNRIKKYYSRDSEVIFPPVDTQRFNLPFKKGEYFLIVSRLVPYKKIDVIIQAFNQLPNQQLVVIGTGSEESRLKRLAQGENIQFLGFVPEENLPAYFQHAHAYLQANTEDFGISMVEAQAAGLPVIAYQQGGASDIVIPNVTGILLKHNDVQSIITAVDNFDQKSFDREACRKNAARFDLQSWHLQFRNYLKPYGY